MRIERTAPKPLKTYPIAIPNNVDKKMYNLHIYDDKSRSKRSFVFVISKDDKKVDIINKENIISLINIEKQEDVKFLVNQLGKAVSDVKKLERQSYDHDFIEAINKYTTDIDKNIWISKTATRYISRQEIKTKQTQAAAKNTANQNLSSEDLIIRQVKPIVLLDTLSEMGIIDMQGTQPNGSDELKYKFVFSDPNLSSKKFNVSVAKYGYLSGNKANLFNDFSNQKNTALGGGALGLIAHLGEYGLFDFTGKNVEDKKSISKAFLLNNVMKHIPEDKLVESNQETSRVYFTGKAITFQPIVKEDKNSMKLMTDFLEFRGLRKNTVAKMVNNGTIVTGSFYNSKIIEEYTDDNELKTNYFYINKPLVRLRGGYKNDFFGAERFQIKKTNNSNRPFDYDKKNIGMVDGRYWSDGEQKNPDLAIIHEAFIDGSSSMELLDYAGLDSDKIRYFSTQGTSHFKKFLTKNIGFWAKNDKSGVKDEFKSFVVYNNQKEYDITEDVKKEYQEKFKDREFLFFDYGDSPKSMQYKINAIKQALDIDIKVIKSKRENINFNSYDKVKSILLDKENFQEFLDNTKLKIIFDEKLKKNVVKTFYARENEVPFTANRKDSIVSKIKRFFGTTNLVYCLDNDEAALKYLPVFTEMERHLDINVGYMIPNDDAKANVYGQFTGLRLNQMMKDYKQKCKDGKYQEAYMLLDKYIEQKPNVDNNDVLNRYLHLAKNEPEKAEQLLQSKVEELNVPKNQLTFKKKAAKRLKP